MAMGWKKRKKKKSLHSVTVLCHIAGRKIRASKIPVCNRAESLRHPGFFFFPLLYLLVI